MLWWWYHRRRCKVFVGPDNCSANLSCTKLIEWIPKWCRVHYNGVIMGTIVSQITSLTIVYSTVYSGADQRKHQSSASPAFVRGIHRWLMNYPHKWRVTRKIFPFDDVIMRSMIKGEAQEQLYVCKNPSFTSANLLKMWHYISNQCRVCYNQPHKWVQNTVNPLI